MVARHDDGAVHAFHNRCTHRGAQVCAAASLDSPKARVNHHLTNIMVEQDPGGGLTARACLLFAEYRREEQRWFSGRSTWKLREAGPTFRILSKRVDLLNADQDGGHLRFAIPF
jgi:3-phenylpropionate/cinnamic acid dioxygenase small subunit